MGNAQAAQTNGAATAAQPPPASEDGEAEAPSLMDMLDGTADLPEGTGPAEQSEEDGDEGAVEDGEPAKGDEEESDPAAAKDTEADEEANRLAEDEAFSDKALASKDGVKRARELVVAARKAAEQRQKRLDRFDSRLHKREKRMRAEIQGELEKLRPQQELARRFASALHLLQTGTAAERLAALSNMTGVPGVELLEELNMGVLADGKKPPPSREVRALEAKLAELEQMLRDKSEREQGEQVERERLVKRERIAEHAAEAAELGGDAEKYPAIAAEIAKWGDKRSREVGEWVVTYIADHYKRTGERLDKPKVLDILDARLAKAAGGSASEPRKGSTVRDPAKSPVAQRRSAGRGVTVTPDLADRSTGNARELTREERIAELARDRDALRELGLGAFAD